MKAVSMVGIAVGVLALILAIVALAGRPEGAEKVRPEVAALKKELRGVSSELGKLDAKLDDLSTSNSRLQRAVAEARAPAAEVDPAKVREIVRAEMRTQVARVGGATRGRGGGETSAQALRERVGLDEEKAGRVAKIGERLREGMRNIWRENRGGDREKIGKLMRELREKGEKEIAELLTPEEMKKYRELTARGRRGRGRREREEGRREKKEEPAADDEF